MQIKRVLGDVVCGRGGQTACDVDRRVVAYGRPELYLNTSKKSEAESKHG